jgi:DNA-binding GntR family transcriptional regulator
MSGKIINLSLFEEVAERIQQQIISQDLKPGERIDEQALAEQFGISRTPMREALKVLQAEGLVELVPRRGCFVARLTEKDLDDIYDILAMFEGRCAAVFAKSASEEERKRLELLHARMQQAAEVRDLDRYSAANVAVHEALLEIGGNRWQKRVIQNLRRVLKLSYKLTIHLPGRLESSLEEHRELMGAIAERDAERAERVLNKHIMQQRLARNMQVDTAQDGDAPVRAAHT